MNERIENINTKCLIISISGVRTESVQERNEEWRFFLCENQIVANTIKKNTFCWGFSIEK